MTNKKVNKSIQNTTTSNKRPNESKSKNKISIKTAFKGNINKNDLHHILGQGTSIIKLQRRTANSKLDRTKILITCLLGKFTRGKLHCTLELVNNLGTVGVNVIKNNKPSFKVYHHAIQLNYHRLAKITNISWSTMHSTIKALTKQRIAKVYGDSNKIVVFNPKFFKHSDTLIIELKHTK